MNITKFIKEQKFQAYTRMLQHVNIHKDRKKELAEQITHLYALSSKLPNYTNASETLKGTSGTEVTITQKLYDGRATRNFNTILNYKDGYIDGNPIIGFDSAISEIRDRKTGNIIYQNEYYLEPVVIQVAKVFGIKKGLETANKIQNMIDSYINESKNYYEETCNALNSIPTLLKESKPFISTAEKEKWEKTVCDCANGTYHGGDIKAVIHCMKLLNENASLDKVNAYLDKQKDSGTFYHHIREMFIYFAPNGNRLRLQDHELIDAE